ncbi:NrfD/PsrC family molybdoenzyme membrane anchor subunit [Occallatibacter riparius]|uniref:Polysulfide reductase NrfD n=1 Tax=Occallatibacter riparius TaxID=1002689 RepID=A0A9J7BNW1_9BACT|nr:NrfD/PsrC family molybdoenzyme membrane anchor subunit [Occallatibacter riparius]UWZ84572.1 polysulfide reductase NrfD [Occallatibacter riparius]
MAELQEINDPRDVFSQLTPAYDIQRSATPERVGEPGYYGLPILKRPFWRWEIALYFFFEGISAGAYTLSAIADLTGNERYAKLVRRGRLIAFATMLACPPLLIADLGRPERFHHMLRIFKKTSPMNHGAWALSGDGLFATLLAVFMIPAARLPFGRVLLHLLQRLLPARVVSALGLPFALTMISYPGVLLETTANPVWSHTNFLGPLFAASSMSTGAAALALASGNSNDHELDRQLARFEDISAAAEAASLIAYAASAGPATRPFTTGSQSALFVLGAIGLGIVAPAVLRRSRSSVLRSVFAPLMTIAGGLALKWAITNAGQESAMDAELANRNAPSSTGRPFWGPRSDAGEQQSSDSFISSAPTTLISGESA